MITTRAPDGAKNWICRYFIGLKTIFTFLISSGTSDLPQYQEVTIARSTIKCKEWRWRKLLKITTQTNKIRKSPWKRLKMSLSWTNAASAIMRHLTKAIWWLIWKHTAEKKETNAINVIMQAPIQVLWMHIYKYIAEKSRTNAINAILLPLGQAVWRHIWKHTVGKSQTNATSVNMH